MTKDLDNNFIQTFRESAPYINAHRGETFVIVLDHATLQSPNLAAIVHDIALLNSLGVRLVLTLNIPNATASLPDHTKAITSQDTLEVLKQTNGKFRCEIEALFSCGLPNTPMHGANITIVSGNFIIARPLGVIDGIDYQFSGAVRRVDRAAITPLLDNRQVVLISNLAYSSTGECFHVDGIDIAVNVGKALRASKLLVYAADNDIALLPRELMPQTAQSLYQQHPMPSLDCLIQGCQQGILRNHMISYDQEGALLSELFTRDGSGIMLSKDAFETIDLATIHDVGGIMELLKPLEDRGILAKRERELLEQEIGHFIVIKRDSVIIACSALYPYTEGLAEIACVATHPDYRGNNRASRMLDYLESQAKQQGIQNLFVLTTQSAHFFLERSYHPADMSILPKEKKALYNFQRNSKVFIKQIQK